MMDALLATGQRLAEALHAENEALSALDLPRAAVLATAKMQAADAFAAAFATARKTGPGPKGRSAASRPNSPTGCNTSARRTAGCWNGPSPSSPG